MSEWLTNSRRAAWQRCARLHFYAYTLRLRPERPGRALAIGSAVHAGLEDLWRGQVHTVDRARHGITDVDEAMVRVLLAGYVERWGDEDAGRMVHGIELPFVAPLSAPDGTFARQWWIAGKLDVVIEEPDGSLWIVEHKTTAEEIAPGSHYLRRQRMAPQLSLYLDGARSIGINAEGVILDVIRKPQLRRGASETVEAFAARLATAMRSPCMYARHRIHRTDADLDAARADWCAIASQIEAEAHADSPPPRNVDSCFDYFRPCEYLALCLGEHTPWDGETGLVQLRTPHPELAGDATPLVDGKEHP